MIDKVKYWTDCAKEYPEDFIDEANEDRKNHMMGLVLQHEGLSHSEIDNIFTMALSPQS